mmetsp:Transcript_96075/g.213935  ORF Transcript_96075/g.213935 Transcript_96075/m.213935 type:complete len:518 (-) Transcript_96075:39-1592(-)
MSSTTNRLCHFLLPLVLWADTAWANSNGQMNHMQYRNALDGSTLSHRGEFFEVYSAPIHLQYAEALHRFADRLYIPKELEQRFAGRTMAVTGYEINWQVLDESGEWRPAKCTEAYTHHYQLYLFSSNASAEVVDRNIHPNDDNPWEPPHVHGRRAVPIAATAPVAQVFFEGNGNENRGSFHGVPEGLAQLIDSPSYFRNLYHLLNTRVPGHNASWGPGTGAPLPRASAAKPGAPYSGLIECPCSTRRGDYQHTGIVAQDSPTNTSGLKFKAICAPGGELLKQKNPICHQETYDGGLQCCADKMIMLDADQVIPEAISTYRYHLRFYFEDPEKVATPVREAFFLFAETEDWQSEYKIPHFKTTPARHVLSRTFKARELFGGLLGWNSPNRFNCSRITTAMCGGLSEVEAAGGVFELRYAHNHMHVGSIGGTLVNADTGELLCESRAIYGTGEEPLNELGYVIAIPPCVWHGSSAPLLSLNSTLTSTIVYDASSPHLAVMAMWEMRGALPAAIKPGMFV